MGTAKDYCRVSVFYHSCFKEDVSDIKDVYLRPVKIISPTTKMEIAQNQTYDVIVKYFDDVYVEGITRVYMRLNNMVINPESEDYFVANDSWIYRFRLNMSGNYTFVAESLFDRCLKTNTYDFTENLPEVNVTQYTYVEPIDYTRCLTKDEGTIVANYS